METLTGFEHLLEPLRLSGVAIRNRVVMTATSISEAWRNPRLSGDAYVEYARRRAAGGVGLMIAHPLYVDARVELDPAVLDRHAALAEAVHAEGAALIVQLVHFGATFRTDNDVRRPALWGFGATPTPEGEAVHEMTGEEIERVLAAYEQAAALVADAGCDGVELHGGHGYLLQQSLTPWNNHRDDAWGADRTLFARRLVAATRARLGPDRILGYRTPTDDLRAPDDGGLGPHGLGSAIQRILDTGEIDLLNTTVGYGGPNYGRAIPDYRATEAVNVGKLRRLRELLRTDVPMIGTGRIASPGVAERLLADRDCELVAMTRAQIAEPDLVRKLTTGRAHRIRPCVGANVCVNRKLGGSPETTCFHNPEVLAEVPLGVTPAHRPCRVLVVGAGPAGLKAAETAARRGHDVRIVDARPRSGGRLRQVEATAAADLASSLDHLVGELGEFGMAVDLGTRADASLVEALAPEAVVLATGGTFDRATVPGAGFVVSTAEALEVQLADPVLVHDALGTNEPALVAETLARRGHAVTFATRYETVMPFGGVLHRLAAPRAWHRLLARTFTGVLLGAFEDGVALLVRPDGETVAELPVGTLVAATSPRPSLELVPVLEAAGIPHVVAGDAYAPRTAVEAFRDGHLAGLEVATMRR